MRRARRCVPGRPFFLIHSRPIRRSGWGIWIIILLHIVLANRHSEGRGSCMVLYNGLYEITSEAVWCRRWRVLAPSCHDRTRASTRSIKRFGTCVVVDTQTEPADVVLIPCLPWAHSYIAAAALRLLSCRRCMITSCFLFDSGSSVIFQPRIFFSPSTRLFSASVC